MAKEVIVLDVQQAANTGSITVNYLLWLPVPVGQETILGTSFTSQWTGIAAPELTLLQNGNVIEERYSASYASGTTKTAIQADLVARFNARLAAFNARPNPRQFYGVFFDSITGWSA